MTVTSAAFKGLDFGLGLRSSALAIVVLLFLLEPAERFCGMGSTSSLRNCGRGSGNGTCYLEGRLGVGAVAPALRVATRGSTPGVFRRLLGRLSAAPARTGVRTIATGVSTR